MVCDVFTHVDDMLFCLDKYQAASVEQIISDFAQHIETLGWSINAEKTYIMRQETFIFADKILEFDMNDEELYRCSYHVDTV